MKAADDSRALNKKFVIRPKTTTVSFNSVVEVWEKKIRHSLHKTYLSAAEVHKQVEGKASNHQHHLPSRKAAKTPPYKFLRCLKIWVPVASNSHLTHSFYFTMIDV